jgi:exopolysaccharide biosynthesis polyprenyl glycosylphosphotransferase
VKDTRRLRQVLFFLCDAGFLFFSLFLALVIRNAEIPSPAFWNAHLRPFIGIFFAWLVIFYVAGLYDMDKELSGLDLSAKLFWSVAIGILISVLYFYLVPAPIGPRTTLAYLAVISFGTLLLWRGAYTLIASRLAPRRAVVFVGMDPIVPEIVQELRQNKRHGFEVVALYDEGRASGLIDGLECYGDPETFVWNAVRKDVHLVVMADQRGLSDQTRGALFSLVSLPARFIRLPEFYETIFQKVPVGSINDLWFLENIDLKAKRPYEGFKRVLDFILSAIGLALTLPLYPIIIACIRIGSKGPALFHQVRLGKGGKPFVIWKFRTMRTESNDFAPTGASDSRITRLGSLLRKSRIDEWPQLINIIKGEMSLVGPRPERPELAEELERHIPFYRQRLLVKPGVTGWDQVSGEYHSPSVEDTYKKLQYDLYYVKHMSFLFDLSVLLKTIMTVLRREGR